MPRGVSRTREAERQARRAREAEVDRLFRFARLEFSCSRRKGSVPTRVGVVAGVTAGDAQQLLQVLLLDNQWFGRDVPGGVVLCRHDAFASRASAERSAKVWRAKFARIDGEAVEGSEA